MQTIFYIFASANLAINMLIGFTLINNKNAADKKALQNYGDKIGIGLVILSMLTAGALMITTIKLDWCYIELTRQFSNGEDD